MSATWDPHSSPLVREELSGDLNPDPTAVCPEASLTHRQNIGAQERPSAARPRVLGLMSHRGGVQGSRPTVGQQVRCGTGLDPAGVRCQPEAGRGSSEIPLPPGSPRPPLGWSLLLLASREGEGLVVRPVCVNGFFTSLWIFFPVQGLVPLTEAASPGPQWGPTGHRRSPGLVGAPQPSSALGSHCTSLPGLGLGPCSHLSVCAVATLTSQAAGCPWAAWPGLQAPNSHHHPYVGPRLHPPPRGLPRGSVPPQPVLRLLCCPDLLFLLLSIHPSPAAPGQPLPETNQHPPAPSPEPPPWGCREMAERWEPWPLGPGALCHAQGRASDPALGWPPGVWEHTAGMTGRPRLPGTPSPGSAEQPWLTPSSSPGLWGSLIPQERGLPASVPPSPGRFCLSLHLALPLQGQQQTPHGCQESSGVLHLRRA